MVKTRMNTADVAAEVRCLRKLIGMRCANVYDLSPKTYVIKLAKSSGLTSSGEGERALVLLESGNRFHMTEFSRDKSATPSGFTLKLRKHIRTRRLENVQQLGVDRIVDFQFGSGEHAHHIILELYSHGNVLLTDAEFNVLTLLRSHRDDNKGIAMMARHRYPIEVCRRFERTSMEKLVSAMAPYQQNEVEGEEEAEHHPRKPITRDGGDEGTLKGALLRLFGFGHGPALCEHIIVSAGLQPGMKPETMTEGNSRDLLGSIDRFETWLESVVNGELFPGGYIFFQKPGKKKKNTVDDGEKIFDEFSPLILSQSADRICVVHDSFDAALDEYFSKIEGQKIEQQRKAQENSALSKLEKIRADQRNRVESLKKEVDISVQMAELIEYNLSEVDTAIEAVRAALANGMDWKDLGRMIKDERKAGNPVAGLIHSLQLEKNQITLLLSNNLDDMDDDEKTEPATKVEVDIGLSAHANARKYFGLKKKQALKQEKTVAAHEKAFKAAERKTQQQLAQAKTVASISHMRKVHWFEKFNWFISSENFLIISGRDAQQNEQLVKRYMKRGDLYVHADLHGASSTIIKNHDPSQPVPPLTINQAGCFTVCRSQAWDSKIITSAWWVYDHQVSKTAPTGEYLTVGSFMIRGKKNFLPPYPLVMGFGLLFRLEESCIPAHFNERRIRSEAEASMDDSKSKTAAAEARNEGEDEAEELDDDEARSGDERAGEPWQMEELEETVEERDEQQGSGSDSDLGNLLDKALELKPVIPTGDKYGLGEAAPLESAAGDDEEPEQGKQAAREKPYVSKAERRKLKKGGGKKAEQNDSDDGEASTQGKSGEKEENKQVRGKKKGKMKKLQKYAEQDEEERALRMSLLSSAGKKEVVSSEKKEASAKTNNAAPREVICYICKKSGHVSSDCPEAKAEIATLNAEENIVDLDDEEKEKLTELDSLTGKPLADDILLYAVPVCGPYSAVQSYKFHVKLTPGTAKKGKGAKTAMDAFIHSEGVTGREKELMKVVAEHDLVACMIGNVKVSAPGLAKLKQTQKKSKKQSTKNT